MRVTLVASKVFTHTTLKSLALKGALYIYDISRLRVKMISLPIHVELQEITKLLTGSRVALQRLERRTYGI
jgi:hypothetical protein